MKKRTLEQQKISRVIYRKHAARHKANRYPLYRCIRMMAIHSIDN